MTLHERLKNLTAPCREVDAEIAVMFRDCPKVGGDPDHWLMRNFPPEAWRSYGKGCVAVGTGKDCVNFTSAKFTSSLDAVVELVEREMPGWFWAVNAMDRQNNRYIAEIGDKVDDAVAEHSLRAVALLLALLDAKEATEEAA